MLGYCMDCHKLVSIRKGAQRWGSREHDYYPITHDTLDGARCTGDKKAIR